MKRKILYLTGTRADYGKVKSILFSLEEMEEFELHLFVTGMHMFAKYGSTHEEIEKDGFRNVYRFINQNHEDTMDTVLAKTVGGLSDFVKELCPDMIVIHGDRVEALAGSIVGSLNNIRVSHIEGGEVSGTVDESIRHAVTKLSHFHFVANEKAGLRLAQLGEEGSTIFVVGSPDIDIMLSSSLPGVSDVRDRYDIPFEKYSIMIFHPVTTELESLERQAEELVSAVIESRDNYVVIYPNSDHGSSIIFRQYERLRGIDRIKIYPSLRFEYFLSLLKNAQYIIGNSSAGVREAPYYGVPTINVGTRQHKRVDGPTIINCHSDRNDIAEAIDRVAEVRREPSRLFGVEGSAERFIEAIKPETIWKRSSQKTFVDLPEA